MDECWERDRPIRVRNVGTSGTKGVGGGIGREAMRVEVEEGRTCWSKDDGVVVRMGRRRIMVVVCVSS